MGHPQCKTGGSITWSGAVQHLITFRVHSLHSLQTQNCYFLADTVVTHQVEVQDIPWRPQYSHTLLTQMGKVSCLAGLTTASIRESLKYRKQPFKIHENFTNTSDTPTVLYNYRAP